MMRTLLLAFIFGLGAASLVEAENIGSFVAKQRAEENQNHLTRGDLNFFFSQISFKDGSWRFILSPNVRGLLWRIRTDHSDETGACDSGQVLNVPRGASLLVKRKDLDLFFEPLNLVSFDVRLALKSESGDSEEEREAQLAAHGSGFSLRYGED